MKTYELTLIITTDNNKSNREPTESLQDYLEGALKITLDTETYGNPYGITSINKINLTEK